MSPCHLVILLLLAFALRLWALDGQSLSRAEALPLYAASQPLADLLTSSITIDGAVVHDTGSPLYLALLRSLSALTGDSIFSLRYLSVLFGLLAIPLLYQLGRLLYPRPIALGAALLLALSPFHIWQNQEIGPSSLFLLLTLLAAYALTRYLAALSREPLAVSRNPSIEYGLRFTAYVSRNTAWLLLAILSLLPILLYALNASQPAALTLPSITRLLTHATGAYSVGIIHGGIHPWWRFAPLVLIFIAGIIATWVADRQSGHGLRLTAHGSRLTFHALLLGYLLAAALFALSIANPFDPNPAPLLLGLPPFLLLAAAGALWPWSNWRGRALGLGAAALLIQLTWLPVQSGIAKDDLRGAAYFLNEVVTADDLVVVHDAITQIAFDRYYSGPAPLISIPAYGELSAEPAIRRLQELTGDAARVWFLAEPLPDNGFPSATLTTWMDEHWRRLWDRRFPSLWQGVNLLAYVPEPTAAALPETVTPLDVRWGEDLRLAGFESAMEATAGGWWQPVFYWAKGQPQAETYTLSLRFVDNQGQQWQLPDQPLWPQFPPPAWPDEGLIRYQPPLRLPAGLPPGDYAVRLRIVRAADGQTLPANGQDAEILLLPSLRLAAARYPQALDALPPHEPHQADFGAIELLGADIPSEVDYRPGHHIPVTLYWHVESPPPADYSLRLQLLDRAGTVIGESLSLPSRPDYPPTQWQPGEILAGKTSLLVPATSPASLYTVRLSLLAPEGSPLRAGLRQNIDLAQVEVTPWPLETELPPIANPLQATFGDPAAIELHGYELAPTLAQPGDLLTLTLFWKALTTVNANYTVFVHLTDSQDSVLAQGDGVPANGFRPTTSWRPDEAIVDPHTIPLPPDLPAGTYRLWVGLYDPATGPRLPAFVGGVQQEHDRILLGEVTVGE